MLINSAGSSAGGSTCTPCPDGHYCPGDDQQYECAAGLVSAEDYGSCVCADSMMTIVDDVCVCSPLSTLVDQACQCVANAVLIGNSCQCDTGFEFDASANECVACAANYYKDHVGNDACSPCRVNSGTGLLSVCNTDPAPYGDFVCV